jgi:hypothetical protein
MNVRWDIAALLLYMLGTVVTSALLRVGLRTDALTGIRYLLSVVLWPFWVFAAVLIRSVIIVLWR